MYSSLQHFLFPLAQQVVSILCSNYALEGILEMQSQNKPAKNEKDELLRVIVSAIIPTPSTFASFLTTTTPTFDHQSPSITILYDFISARLQSLLAESEQRLDQARNDATPYVDVFCDLFSRLVATDSIHPALQLIVSTSSLLRSFMIDFFSRTLHLSPQIPYEWIVAISNIFVKFAQDFGIRTNSHVLDYFLVYYLQRDLVLNFCTLARPLLDLRNPSVLLSNIITSFADLQIRYFFLFIGD